MNVHIYIKIAYCILLHSLVFFPQPACPDGYICHHGHCDSGRYCGDSGRYCGIGLVLCAHVSVVVS